MPRIAKLAYVAPLLALVACAPAFEKAITPSGDPCVDMPVIPGGTSVDRPYHRVGAVASDARSTTEAERLWSLRREACLRGADAVIEAVNEEANAAGGGYVTRASGTAVVYERRPTASAPMKASGAP